MTVHARYCRTLPRLVFPASAQIVTAICVTNPIPMDFSRIVNSCGSIFPDSCSFSINCMIGPARLIAAIPNKQQVTIVKSNAISLPCFARTRHIITVSTTPPTAFKYRSVKDETTPLQDQIAPQPFALRSSIQQPTPSMSS